MTRTLAPIALALALALSAPGLAQDRSPVEAAFGNTIVSTYPDGRQAELWLKRDGAYDAEGRRHDRSKGRWKVSNGALCLKQSHPFAFGYTFCTPLKEVSLGAAWSAKAVTGEPIRVKLVRGHVDPAPGGTARQDASADDRKS
jgi:hypothetical protein